jgi:hypothetical protein
VKVLFGFETISNLRGISIEQKLPQIMGNAFRELLLMRNTDEPVASAAFAQHNKLMVEG